MDRVYIDAAEDVRFDHYRNIRDRDLNTEGVLIAEGKLLAERLLYSGNRGLSVLVSSRMAEKLDFAIPEDVPLYVADDKIIEAIAGFKFHRGILAVAERPVLFNENDLEEAAAVRNSFSMVICPNAGNDENLGALIRTAGALGIDYFVIGESSCDPFSRRALKAGMGVQFNYPVYRIEQLYNVMAKFKEKYKMKIYFAAISDDSVNIRDVQFERRCALFLGNEYGGIDGSFDSLCDEAVEIAMLNSVDSLNLAVSGGILMYEMKNEAGK